MLFCKNLLIVIFLELVCSICVAQSKLFQSDTTKIAKLIDSARIELIRNPRKAFQLSTISLLESRKNDFLKGIVLSGIMKGMALSSLSQYENAIEVLLETNIEAEKLNDPLLLARTLMNLGLVYGKLDPKVGLFYMKKSKNVLEKNNLSEVQIPINMTLGFMYKDLDILDSALIYLQKSYEFSLRNKRTTIISTCNSLGQVHDKFGHLDLALSYYKQSLAYSKLLKINPSADIYTNLAHHFKKRNQKDSVLFYAQKSLLLAQSNSSFKNQYESAKILFEEVKDGDPAEALHYHLILSSAKDSLSSIDKIREIEQLSFKESLRQEELIEIQKLDDQERIDNLQYIAIIIVILSVFFILFLLSKKKMSPKAIKLISTLSLLMTFEFVNLLIHPFLVKITHHVPIFMLLILVLIAAFLVPLHHKIEKWLTHKLID